MEELIKSIEKIYGKGNNMVALIDAETNVIWCNHIPLNIIEDVRPGMNLSKAFSTIFWIQTKAYLDRGKNVNMLAEASGRRMQLFIEPFCEDGKLLYSIVHITEQKTVNDLAASRIIHDLKNPVNMIKLFTKSLEADDKQTILHYCEVALGILSEMQVLSENTKSDENIEDINMTEFIGGVFDECRKVLRRQFSIDVQLPDKMLVCRVNAKEIENAVVNLVVNAKNHGSSYIKFELLEKNGCAVIAVENDGGKVDESIRDTLYEPCVKANSSGSGLGLNIVKTVAEKYRGDICLMDTDNTRFEFSIPLSVAAQVRSSDGCPEINAEYIKYVVERRDG